MKKLQKSILYGVITTLIILLTHFNIWDPSRITLLLTMPAYLIGTLISGNVHQPEPTSVVMIMLATFILTWYLLLVAFSWVGRHIYASRDDKDNPNP